MNLTRRSLLTLSVAATAVCASSSSFAQSKKHKRVNPVLFWNAVALDLVAFDHSVEPAIARAPGPCASARALGVVHAAIADAVHYAYPSGYKPRFYRSRVEHEIESPDLFVGGAAYAVLSYVFDTQMHRYMLEMGAEGFKKLVGAWGSNDWEAGIAFGNSPPFRKLWVWEHMQQSLLPQFSNYVPKPRQHNIDPYNAGKASMAWAGAAISPLS